MAIQIGQEGLKSIQVGQDEVKEVWIGDKLVWSKVKNYTISTIYSYEDGVDFTDIVFKKPGDSEWDYINGSKVNEITLPEGTQYFIQSDPTDFENYTIMSYLGSEEDPYILKADIQHKIVAGTKISINNPFYGYLYTDYSINFSIQGYFSDWDSAISDYFKMDKYSTKVVSFDTQVNKPWNFTYESDFPGEIQATISPVPEQDSEGSYIAKEKCEISFFLGSS